MDWWVVASCNPILDPDSDDPNHQGDYSIPPFQTHSRLFYAPLGEECCDINFVVLYYLQGHPFPHCRECALRVLRAASHICWQCRTYFRRYGSGLLQQIVGVTPQRHDIISVIAPDSGLQQRRLPIEQRAQEWRNEQQELLVPTLLHTLLPPESNCRFWVHVCSYIELFPYNENCLLNLPTITMPYYNDEALLPLPSCPERGFRSGLSIQQEEINNVYPADIEVQPQPNA